MGKVKRIFSPPKPKIRIPDPVQPPPTPPTPPAAPTPEEANEVANTSETSANDRRRRRGQLANVLTAGDNRPGLGNSGAPTVVKKLLGH